MTASSKARPLGAILLVLSLCAPMLANARPAADRDRATEFRALATPSSTVLLTCNGARYDHVRQRPSAPSLLTLLPVDSTDSDPGRLTGAGESRFLYSLWTEAPRTGRSPPWVS
jgi:hypothetical protein